MSDNTENKQPLGFFNIDEDVDWDEVVNSLRESAGLERLSHEELNEPLEEGLPYRSNKNKDESVE